MRSKITTISISIRKQEHLRGRTLPAKDHPLARYVVDRAKRIQLRRCEVEHGVSGVKAVLPGLPIFVAEDDSKFISTHVQKNTVLIAT
jgi:hypothetical protein